MIYKTSLDKLAKGITISFELIFIITFFYQLFHLNNSDIISSFTISFAMFFVFLSCFLLRPISYELTTNYLIINRPILSVTYAKDQVSNVQLLEKDQTSGSIRIFGVGGFFGYYGKFWNSKIGWMTWYATRRNNYVLIEMTSNKKIILTPDEPEKFVANFNS